MKLKTIHIKYILIPVLLIVVTDSVIFSQGTDTTKISRPELFIGINVGSSRTHINNRGIQSVSELSSVIRNSFSGSFESGYSFSKSIGLSIGLGFDSYKTDLSLNTYANKFNSIDSENESYERRIAGTDIKEIQTISFLNLPLCIDFQLPVSSRFGFFLQTGISFSIPMSKKYNSSGTFTYTGFYPAYNALLQDLPAYGFVSNTEIKSDGSLELKTFNIDGMANAGFQYLIRNKIRIALGIHYNRSLSNISKYSSPDSFQLSSDINQINSMMGGSSKVTAQSIGLRLSFRYYLK